MEKKVLGAIIFSIAVAVAGFFYWKTYYTPPVEETATQASSTDLGTELYNQANNPIGGQLPENVNPLEGVYKNPFE